PDADALGGRVPGRALESRALVPARVGLDPLGLVQLSLQLHRSARRVGPRRVHASRVAGRAPDRRPSLRGSDGVTGLRGVRSGAPLGPAPPGARLTRDRLARSVAPGAAAAGVVMAVGGAAFAQQPGPVPPGPRAKGPRVWLDLDQAELDAD